MGRADEARTAALPPPVPCPIEERLAQPAQSLLPELWLPRVAAVPVCLLVGAQTPAESMAARITRHSRGKPVDPGHVPLGADSSQTPTTKKGAMERTLLPMSRGRPAPLRVGNCCIEGGYQPPRLQLPGEGEGEARADSSISKPSVARPVHKRARVRIAHKSGRHTRVPTR